MKLNPVLSGMVLSACLAACHAPKVSQPKIVGGEPSDQPYPFFVGLFQEGDSTSYCGASLIAKDVVLTAAHCVADLRRPIEVAVGLVQNERTEATRMYPVKAIKVHENFDPATYRSDIALVFLDQVGDDPSLEAAVIPINRDPAYPDLSAALRVIGHGNISSAGWVPDPQLYQVDLPIIPSSFCQTLGGIYSGVDETMICAGDLFAGGRDSCQGDSGGPLLTPASSASPATLVGLVSFGDGCAQKQKPGVYTRVSSFVEWIDAGIASYRQPPSPLTIAQVQSQLDMYCYQDFVNQRADSGETSQLFREEYLTLPARWQPADHVQSIDQILGQANVQEIQRCVQQTTAGDAFTLVFVSEPGTGLESAGLRSYLELGGRWYEASRTPEYTNYFFACDDGDTELFTASFFQQADYTSVNLPFAQFGTRTSTLPGDLTLERNCAVAEHEAALYNSPQAGRFLRIQLPQDVEASWFQLEQGASDDGFALYLASIGETKGFLEIANDGAIDVFTWQLSCDFEFSLQDRLGTRLTSILSSDGYYVVRSLFPAERNGSIQTGTTRSFLIELSGLNVQDLGSRRCEFNGIDVPIQVRTI